MVKRERQIAVRISDEVYDRLEQRAAAMAKSTGLDVSIAAVARLMLENGLDAAEKADKRKKAK